MMAHRKLNFHVYDRSPIFINAFTSLLAQHPLISGLIDITIIPTQNSYYTQSSIEPAVKELDINAIVSPANSFGRMEGGFDLAISKFYLAYVDRPNESATKVSSVIQKLMVLNNKMGYNPPGSVLRLNGQEIIQELEKGNNGLPKYRQHAQKPAPDLLLLPAMAKPSTLQITKRTLPFQSVIFTGVWNLLSILAETHIYEEKLPSDSELRIMITGLGTGVGKVSHDVAAEQMYKAIFIFDKALKFREDGYFESIDHLIKNEVVKW